MSGKENTTTPRTKQPIKVKKKGQSRHNRVHRDKLEKKAQELKLLSQKFNISTKAGRGKHSTTDSLKHAESKRKAPEDMKKEPIPDGIDDDASDDDGTDDDERELKFGSARPSSTSSYFSLKLEENRKKALDKLEKKEQEIPKEPEDEEEEEKAGASRPSSSANPSAVKHEKIRMTREKITKRDVSVQAKKPENGKGKRTAGGGEAPRNSFALRREQRRKKALEDLKQKVLQAAMNDDEPAEEGEWKSTSSTGSYFALKYEAIGKKSIGEIVENKLAINPKVVEVKWMADPSPPGSYLDLKHEEVKKRYLGEWKTSKDSPDDLDDLDSDGSDDDEEGKATYFGKYLAKKREEFKVKLLNDKKKFTPPMDDDDSEDDGCHVRGQGSRSGRKIPSRLYPKK